MRTPPARNSSLVRSGRGGSRLAGLGLYVLQGPTARADDNGGCDWQMRAPLGRNNQNNGEITHTAFLMRPCTHFFTTARALGMLGVTTTSLEGLRHASILPCMPTRLLLNWWYPKCTSLQAPRGRGEGLASGPWRQWWDALEPDMLYCHEYGPI